MAGEPAVSICRVKEVELSPLELSQRSRLRASRARLLAAGERGQRCKQPCYRRSHLLSGDARLRGDGPIGRYAYGGGTSQRSQLQTGSLPSIYMHYSCRALLSMLLEVIWQGGWTSTAAVHVRDVSCQPCLVRSFPPIRDVPLIVSQSINSGLLLFGCSCGAKLARSRSHAIVNNSTMGTV